MTKPRPGAVNAAPRVITEYGADPHHPGLDVGRGIWRYLNGMARPFVGGGKEDPGNQYHGIYPRVQDFTGAAAMIGANTVYRSGKSGDIADTKSTETASGDPIRRLFAARMARGAGA